MDQDTKNNEAPVSNGPAKITLRISQHKEWKVEQLDIDHIQFRTSAIDTISQKVTATQIHWIHEGKGKFVISSGSISSSELSFKSGAIIDIQKVQFTDCKLITTGQGTSMNFRECKFTRCALSLERSTLLEIDKCIGEPSITRKP